MIFCSHKFYRIRTKKEINHRLLPSKWDISHTSMIDCLSKSYYSLLRSILSTILFLSKCIGHLVEYLFFCALIIEKKVVYEYRFAMKRNYCKYTYIYIWCDNDMWKYSSVLVFFLLIIIKVKFRFEWIIFNWIYKYLFLEE
jgi:hypothetical protein